MRLTLPLLFLAAPALAEITVEEATAVRPFATAPTGAAYMAIHNDGPADRLTGVAAEGVGRVELHLSTQAADGTMAMEHQEDGVAIPEGGHLLLLPGGFHVMLMGLGEVDMEAPLALTLTFETAGEIAVSVPWGSREDLGALTDMAGHHGDGGTDHGAMDHGTMDHGTMDHGGGT